MSMLEKQGPESLSQGLSHNEMSNDSSDIKPAVKIDERA